MITAGTYKARVDGECVLGASKNKGTPFIEFYLKILEGENTGGYVKWTGYFTENTNERAIQSLQICGWTGDDLSEFSDGQLHGLDTNEVSIVVELESYENDEGETKTHPKVQWINRVGGFLNQAAALNKGAADAFGARMRGLVLKMKEKNPVAPAKPAAPKPATTRAPQAQPAPMPDSAGFGGGGDDEIPF